MVGTFFRSRRVPMTEAFVETGDQVEEGPGAMHCRGDEGDERGES